VQEVVVGPSPHPPWSAPHLSSRPWPHRNRAAATHQNMSSGVRSRGHAVDCVLWCRHCGGVCVCGAWHVLTLKLQGMPVSTHARCSLDFCLCQSPAHLASDRPVKVIWQDIGSKLRHAAGQFGCWEGAFVAPPGSGKSRSKALGSSLHANARSSPAQERGQVLPAAASVGSRLSRTVLCLI
jgi:hypothetical protein